MPSDIDSDNFNSEDKFSKKFLNFATESSEG